MNTNNQTPVMSSTSTNLESHDKRIDTLFMRLGAIYGHIWWSNYQNERALAFAQKEWSEALQRFDNRTIKESLLKFREQKSFPPTLPQFVESCKDLNKRREPSSLKKEPIRPGSVEVAKKHLNTMLQILRP